MSPFEGLFNRGDAQSRVASLIEKLGNTDEKTVNNAMKDLAKHMPLATGRLLQAINDHTAEVEWKESQKAIDALDSNTQRAVKTLISDLASGDKKKYDMALNALMQTGNQQMAMSILNLATFEMKAKSSIQRRRKALELLSQASTIEQDKSITISALVSALGDGYPARDLTKKLLSRYGNEVTPHLLVALQRGYVDLRRQASEELMEKPPDLPQHIAVLTGYIYDSDNVVALNVIKALYKVGSLPKEAIQTLFRIYNQDKNYSDRSAINRHHEADDLIMKLGPNNIEVFAEALRHPGTKNYTQSVDFIYRISEQYPQAVKKIARPYLYDTLLKQEGGNKTDIAHIIQHIGASIDDLPDLLSTFSSNNPEMCSYIRATISPLGTEALPKLAALLNSNDPQVLENAVLALEVLNVNLTQVNPQVISQLTQTDPAIIIDSIFKRIFAIPRSYQEDVYSYNPHHSVFSTCQHLKDILHIMAPISALNGELIDLAVQASTYKDRLNEAATTSDEQIKQLCHVNSPVTSNILHLVSQKKDVEVGYTDACGYSSSIFTSFQSQRDQALDELKKRGNPPYQKEAYRKTAT